MVPVVLVSSLLSPCHLRHPHIVPTSSPHRPCCPQKVPMWSPWSVVSTCCPHRHHVIPVVPASSPRRPRCPQKVPMWSPWSVVSTCCLHHPHVVPIVPTSSRRSPHHPQPPRYPLHPPPTPLGGWGPQISKNAIRFELIKIF